MASDDRENVWENFLRRYYKDEIEDLVAFGRSSLEVDYQDLVTFNRKLADSLVGSPKSVLSDAEDTLLDFNVQNEADLPEDATLIFSNLPKTKLSELSSSSIGKLVRTYGVVSEISDEYLIVSRGVFRCQSCATRHVVDMDISREEYQEPSRCKGCQKQGNFKIVEDECDFVSVRDVTLSPPLEEEEFKNSQNYSCVFFGEEAREVSLGDYVSVNVIPTTNGNDGSDLSFYLRTRKVVPEEPSYSYMFDNLDDDEKEAIRKLADEDIYQKFVDSIAPTVPVDDTIKLAMLLQLFGGVEKEVEYTEYRGYIHVLIVSDSGIGIPRLVKSINNIAPRSVYATGDNVTRASLTTNASGNMLTSGLLPAANTGLVYLTGFGDLSRKPKRSITGHLMETRKIPVDKGEYNETVPLQLGLLTTKLPDGGSFDEARGISEQLGVSVDLLEDFDSVHAVVDSSNEEKDRETAGEVLETDPELPVTPDFLSKYVAYARSEVDPGIEDDNQIKDRVADYYSSKREDVGNVVNTNDIESIIRFSEASARARLSETIEIEDIDRAIRIVDSNPRYQD